MLKFLLTVVGVSVGSMPVFAETYFYHPNSSVTLGHPYDEMRPSENLNGNNFFEWTNRSTSQEPGLSGVEFSYNEISSFSDYANALSIDASAEAEFGLSSASASLNYDEISSRSENRIVVSITASREFKPRKMEGTLQLSTLGKQYLDRAIEGDLLHLWRQSAGSGVVAETVSGASVSLFYSFTASSKSNMTKLEAAVRAAWSSGEASANIVQSAQSADSSVSVQMTYRRVGGSENTDALSSLLEAGTGNVGEIKAAMAEALQGVTADNARLLRFNTTDVKNMPEIVFTTAGNYTELADFYDQIQRARRVHFERLVIANARHDQAQRLLDSKPDSVFLEGGRGELENLRDDLSEIVSEIREEYLTYNRLNPEGITVATNAGSSIPTLTPTAYFEMPFAQISNWVQTAGSASQCGWATYKNCEFHDFAVQFYPVIQIQHPEFVSRMRLLKNCVPVTSLNQAQVQTVMGSDGSMAGFYQSRHESIQHYTWGLNHMPGAFTGWKAQMGRDEGSNSYMLELVTTDETIHFVTLGAFGAPATTPQVYNTAVEACAGSEKMLVRTD
ncbi:hypothetical protein [uncultured Tateyamaria sp.]|uniref:hypothetical protein n=1 Tax=uncultured Tateyamaria sp. TaxID=455651 RepID=UPI0026383962|nr:hypothetical protein [uncultured Tateyamaria sp.]